MTSTNINVGIGDIKRNTSKVLKPPGGESSVIFGAPEPPASHSLKNTRNLEQLSSGPVMNGTKSPTESTLSSTASSTDGNPVTGDGYESPQKTIRQSTPSAAAADSKPRTRVPPGGFSSGLW